MEWENSTELKQNFYSHVTSLKKSFCNEQRYEMAAHLRDVERKLNGDSLDHYFSEIIKEMLPIYRQNQISSILEDGEYIKPLEVFETKAYQDLLKKCDLEI